MAENGRPFSGGERQCAALIAYGMSLGVPAHGCMLPKCPYKTVKRGGGNDRQTKTLLRRIPDRPKRNTGGNKGRIQR